MSPSARRAQILREHWNPIQQRLASGLGSALGFVAARPALSQGIYYVLTGLWPWVSLASYAWLTGESADLWRLQTLGALVVVLSVALCVAGWLHERSWAIVCLAVGSAAAFAFVDVLHAVQGHLSPLSLIDAGVEVGLIVLWVQNWQAVWPEPRRDLGRPVVTAPPAAPVAAPGQQPGAS
jgi:hypothetical protein